MHKVWNFVLCLGEGEWQEQEMEAMEEFFSGFGVLMETFQRKPQSSFWRVWFSSGWCFYSCNGHSGSCSSEGFQGCKKRMVGYPDSNCFSWLLGKWVSLLLSFPFSLFGFWDEWKRKLKTWRWGLQFLDIFIFFYFQSSPDKHMECFYFFFSFLFWFEYLIYLISFHRWEGKMVDLKLSTIDLKYIVILYFISLFNIEKFSSWCFKFSSQNQRCNIGLSYATMYSFNRWGGNGQKISRFNVEEINFKLTSKGSV